MLAEQVCDVASLNKCFCNFNFVLPSGKRCVAFNLHGVSSSKAFAFCLHAFVCSLTMVDQLAC